MKLNIKQINRRRGGVEVGGRKGGVNWGAVEGFLFQFSLKCPKTNLKNLNNICCRILY